MGQLALFENAVDTRTEINLLSQQIKANFSNEELNQVKDLQKFVLKREDGWVLDKNLHSLASKILSDKSDSFLGMRVSLLRIFSMCALRDNFVHFLNLDRQTRVLMNYAASDFGSLSLNEQKGLTLLFCNLFSATQSSKWLMYFSLWNSMDGAETCNAHVTCNLACSAMKSLNPQIQLYASGIVMNMSARNFGVSQALGDIMEPLCLEEQPLRAIDLGDEDGMCHLRAHHSLCLQICICVFDLLIKKHKILPENITSNYIQTLEKLLPTVKGDFLIFEPNASELLGAFLELNEANKSHISNIQQLLIR